MASSPENLRSRKLFRCWNCKHLKTMHRGEPKGGRLFAEKVWRCVANGMVFEKYHEVLRERDCGDHVRVGLWEKPPEIHSFGFSPR